MTPQKRNCKNCNCKKNRFYIRLKSNKPMRYKSRGSSTPMKSISKQDKYAPFFPLQSLKKQEKTPRFDAFPLPNAQKGVSKNRHLFVSWRVFWYEMACLDAENRGQKRNGLLLSEKRHIARRETAYRFHAVAFRSILFSL